MSTTTSYSLASDVIVCYFHRDSTGLVAAFKDKNQTSFLLHFLKSLSPTDIDCKSNWFEIKCNRQIKNDEIEQLNEKLQQCINNRQEYKPLRNCQIMLKVNRNIYFFADNRNIA